MPAFGPFGFGMACVLILGACQRVVAASCVPSVKIQFMASQERDSSLTAHARGAARSGAARQDLPWDIRVVGWLRFEPQIAARTVPARAEFSPELSAAPCELEDVECLEEFGEGQREISHLLGALE